MGEATPPHSEPVPTSPGAQDEVDRIVSAWRTERPDLDPEPLEILSRVARISRQLDRYRAAAFAEHDVETWEFDVLAALRRSGPPYRLSPGQLAGQTMVASGTMTNRIDRLQRRGLVVREQDPDDGRGALILLTPQGRSLVDATFAALLERERELLAGLSPKDRNDLGNLLRQLALDVEPSAAEG